MYDTQQSLLQHLARQFTAPTVNHLAAYAGELREPHQLTTLVPAVLAIFIDGSPNNDQPDHQFELLVITESRTLDKVTSQNDNLKLSTDITEYLRLQPSFVRHSSLGGTYLVDPKRLRARTLAVTDRFTIVAITCYIDDYTKGEA